jgi:MoaA/NifB/PqqE/SkfB family radical SAM enzyme
MRKLPTLARLAGYRAAHATGRLQQLPINLTVSVTYSCPSRCATCDIWQKKVDDLSVDEYGRIFPTLDKVPVWVTLSGGDQFVRADFDEVVRLVRTLIEPSIINIPMNGIITERIFQLLPRIAHHTVGSQLVLNLSVDEIGEAHDRIRGADRNFEKLKLVADLIHDLKKTYAHIVLGVHTVISKLNVERVPEIEREARQIFRPDSYIAEVAENRVELKTMDKDITPEPSSTLAT